MALGGKKIKIKRVAGPERREEEMGLLPFFSENWQSKNTDFLKEPEVKPLIQNYSISNLIIQPSLLQGRVLRTQPFSYSEELLSNQPDGDLDHRKLILAGLWASPKALVTVTFQDGELLSAERSEVQRRGMSAHSTSPSNLGPYR